MNLRNSVALIFFLTIIGAQSGPKNLQILKVKSKSELKQVMENIAGDLGVKCVFCHNMRDKSSDEKNHKLVAREMMKMVQHINSEFLTWEGAASVSCWTCHKGQKEPGKKPEK